ncbi:MAG: electron transfer flavoprotein subunit alpha/FixB family protein [Alphaproteobacteria bacterium]
MAHLIIAEPIDDGYRPSLLNCLSAVKQAIDHGNQGAVHLLVMGSNVAASAKAMAEIAGIDKILVADDAALEHGLAEATSKIVIGIAKNYSHVWAAADTYGKNIAPRVAALLDSQQLSDITGVKAVNQYERPIYAGNALEIVETAESVNVITVRATGFDAAPSTGGAAEIEAIQASAAQDQSNYIGAELSQSERPELTSAKIIISGGRGMQDGKNFEMLDRIADKLGAAVGASRAAVDAGFVPNDYQVGQTGKVVAPDLYIAVGISGAIQHLAGMKDSKVIVAINKDEDAPIFQVADYGLVADLFDALPALDESLN